MWNRRGIARLAALVIAVGAIGMPAIARAQLPTVTIAATDAAASEIGPDTGTFTISRTGSTSALLIVFFTEHVDLVPGVDQQHQHEQQLDVDLELVQLEHVHLDVDAADDDHAAAP